MSLALHGSSSAYLFPDPLRLQLKSFSEFKLPKSVDKALAALQFSVPTPIQEKAIPVALSGKDLVGCAQTGTGKTSNT